MINALPFFPGLSGSPVQGNGQTGGIGLDQPMTTGNPSDNPFAKILRDQSATSYLFASLTTPVPSEDQSRLPDLHFFPEDLSPQDLPDQTKSGDLLRDGSSESVGWPLAGKVQPYPFLSTFLDSGGHGPRDIVDIRPTSLTPLPSSGVDRENEVGTVKILPEPIRLSSLDFSHDTRLSGPVFFPQIYPAGGSGVDSIQTGAVSPPQFFLGERSGVDGIQTQSTILKPGSEYSPIQVPPVWPSIADNSVIPIGTNSTSQQILGEAVKKTFQLVESSAEPDTESVGGTGKPVEKILDRLISPAQDADSLPLRIAPATGRVQPAPPTPVVNQAFPSPIPLEETPANPAEIIQSNLARMKYTNGSSILGNEPSLNGKESALAVPSDLLRDTSVFLTGDRSKDILEAAGKSLGVDPSGGQGLATGMGGSPHSQSGFQQSSSSLSPGLGVRMAEERGPDLPTPALQRLQMEVQLSENNRIQIDVGVQQRQVYAGLLMDHATLKNLAVQFVPQLEEQLAQSDMDLQEFSAEVRDHHREQESATGSDWTASHQGHQGSATFHHAQESHTPSVTRVEERGWHFVV